jgi:hypothetical protein
MTALLIGWSPFAETSAELVMSDAFAAGVTMLLIVLMSRLTPARVSIAGALAAALVAVRLAMVVNLAALFIVLPGRLRRWAVMSAAPILAALGAFNWWAFGSPFSTGYGYWLGDTPHFSPAFILKTPPFGDGPWITADAIGGVLLYWLCPCPLGGPQGMLSNLAFYPAVLIGMFWLFVPPFVPLLGMLFGWQNRQAPAVRFGLWLILVHLALFLVYFYQATRFMAVPATVLGIFAAAKLAGWMGTSRPEALHDVRQA